MGAMPFKSLSVVRARHFLRCFHSIRLEMITHLHESTYMKICKSGSSVREVTIQWLQKMKEMEQGQFFIHNLNHIRAFCAWQHCRCDMMRIDLPFLLWVWQSSFFLPLCIALGRHLAQSKNRKELCSKCDMTKCCIHCMLEDRWNMQDVLLLFQVVKILSFKTEL